MKRNELREIKGLGIRELKEKAKSQKSEIASLVLEKNMKKLKDVKAIFRKRKDLAQILTILKQKELLNSLEVKK